MDNEQKELFNDALEKKELELILEKELNQGDIENNINIKNNKSIDALLDNIREDFQKDLSELKIDLKDEIKNNQVSTPRSSYTYDEENDDYYVKKRKKENRYISL